MVYLVLSGLCKNDLEGMVEVEEEYKLYEDKINGDLKIVIYYGLNLWVDSQLNEQPMLEQIGLNQSS
ncbi:MAG: hypothetical protein GY810_11970 [Aureispira sp.]|nr:hypothetical protein [Aureispira sp.]